MSAVLLKDLASVSAAVGGTRARSAKVELLANALRTATPAEVPVVVAYLSGGLRQRRTGLGYAALRDLPAPAQEPRMTVLEADTVFGRIAELSGPGSQRERRRLLVEVMEEATAEEQQLLLGLVGGDLRQGALDAVVTDAVARASGVPVADVRRAVMLRGDLAPVAAAVLVDGAHGLARFRLEVGRPLRPMLAQSAPTMAAAFEQLGEAAVEWKLDGVRIQVHRNGGDIAVFTRTLDDVTTRVPEVVESVRGLPVDSVVLDGEAIALQADGRPRPFQETAARVGSRVDVERARAATPLTPWFFDVLHVDGEEVLDRPGAARQAVLSDVLPASLLVPRRVTDDVDAAEGFLADAVARGHEGAVVKALDVAWEAGRRGAGWVKVKPRHTLDLVVLAAEWGHGRRSGWLSNLHLGARDPAGGFVMLGKTFKGLTDEMLRWQTERLLSLAEEQGEWVVKVRPELVVEIAFDGVQTSSRYPAGMALRFARVLRHRPDKTSVEADTVDTVRALHVR